MKLSKKEIVAMRKGDTVTTYTNNQLQEAKQQLMHTFTKANEAIANDARNTQAVDWMTDAALAIMTIDKELANRV